MTITVKSYGGLKTTETIVISILPKTPSPTSSISFSLPTQPHLIEEDKVWTLDQILITLNGTNSNLVLTNGMNNEELIRREAEKEVENDGVATEILIVAERGALQFLENTIPDIVTYSVGSVRTLIIRKIIDRLLAFY